MPRTTAEIASEVDEINRRLGMHDIHHAKIDVLLEAIIAQSKEAKEQTELFRNAITGMQTQITLGKVGISFGGAVLISVVSAYIGHLFH